MAITVTQLITRAWYLSGIVSRDLEVVSGDQVSDGLSLLNSLLAIKGANLGLIPYYKGIDITGVAQQEIYFIPKLLNVESLTFFIGPVRYSMIPQSRREYFGSGRVNNIYSLPYQYHIERVLGGANLYIYFPENQSYPLQLWGKFGLDQITDLQQNLEDTYDPFYIEYLRYALAEYMCQEYNVLFQPGSNQKLNEYEQILRDTSPLDLTMAKMSSLQRETAVADLYAQANIGRGWTV